MGSSELASQPNGGFVVMPGPFFANRSAEIAALAMGNRLPAVYPFRYYADQGGLLAYGNDQADNYRRAALYVDRILKGEKAGELPVQARVKFELTLNLKTAKALGLDVPPSSWPAEHGRLAHLRHRQREPQPARLRGAAVGPARPRGGAALWGSGFLPTAYQGVPFRSVGEPILNLSAPQGRRRRTPARRLRRRRRPQPARLADTGDPEIATRIAQYEMAYRMQSSARS